MALAQGPVSYTHLDVYKRQLMSNETKTKLKSVVPFLVLIAIAIAALFAVPEAAFDPASVVDPVTKAPTYTYNSCLLYTSRCV